MQKRVFINNQIRADKVRLVDTEGKQLGIFSLSEALQKAREYGLDLIEITEKTDPPICKIMDYGKYFYQLSKKEKKIKTQKAGELKNVRLTFNISPHDLKTRVKLAEKFLQKGYKVQIEMLLRGREKGLGSFAEEKIAQFLEALKASMPVRIEREMKRQPRGITLIIARE